VFVQSVVPQAPPEQDVAGAQQCVPVPAVPQRLLVHWLFPPHSAPDPPFAAHVPLGPGFWQKVALLWQSPSLAHAVLQDVASAHTNPPAHAAELPELHAPEPLHIDTVVRTPFAHAAGAQTVLAFACSHAPPAAQLPSFPQGGLAVH
jgi:hypothetical protein